MFLYRQKDIVFVPFPFTDASTSKKRPVLIISSDSINSNDSHGDIVATAITSKIRRTPFGIKIDDGDMVNGRLPANESEIQCSKIATIQKNIVIKKFGKINDTIFGTVKSKITDEVLGI